MQLYKEFQPTQFDSKGLCADRLGIGNWLVLPLAQNRDSEILETCNFEVALELLGGESKNVQVHRFGHWANGWFEIIIVNPRCKKKVAIAKDIEDNLENYPILNEEKYSEKLFEAESEEIEKFKSDIAKHLEQTYNLSDVDTDSLALLVADMRNKNYFDFKPEGVLFYHKTLENITKHYSIIDFIHLGVSFKFQADDGYYEPFDFHSDTHPDLLNAELMKALADSKIHGYEYKMSDDTPIDIPAWAYPNPDQIPLPIFCP